MNKSILIFMLFSLLCLWQCNTASKLSLQISESTSNVKYQMTLEEKVGQMTQLTIEMISKGYDRFYHLDRTSCFRFC
jgi:hypothetical protein